MQERLSTKQHGIFPTITVRPFLPSGLAGNASALITCLCCVCACNRCLQLDDTVEKLQDEAKDQQAVRMKLEAQLTAAAQRLGEKHRLMAEVSLAVGLLLAVIVQPHLVL